MSKPTKPPTVIVLRRKFLYAMFIVWGFLFLSGVAVFQYIGFVDRKANERERLTDQQWCELFVYLEKQYQNNPPQNENTRQFAEIVKRRVETLDCPK